MAPKRQRVVERSAGSSSNHPSSGSDSSLGEVEKFISPEAQSEYNRLMTRTVIRERGFLPFQAGELRALVEELGWAPFCESPTAAPLSIVREFYANAKGETNGYSVVRGLTVDYTPGAIRQVLLQPNRGRRVEDWTHKTKADVDLQDIVEQLCVPGTVWKTRAGTNEPRSFPSSALNRYARAWNLFVCASISPSSHSHDVIVERAILLWAIINGHYIDLGHIIHQNIIRFLRSGATMSIPHPSLVTELCRAVGVRWDEDEPVLMPLGAIDDALIERMVEWPGGVPHGRGLGYIITAAERGGMPPRVPQVPRVPRARASSSHGDALSVGFMEAQFRRLNRRIDAMHESNRQYAEDMTSALISAGISAQWPVYGARTVYPPPDSDEEGDDDDSAEL